MSRLDAQLWRDRMADLVERREALRGDLVRLGEALGGASPKRASKARPEAHRLLKELRDACCGICEACAEWRRAGGHDDPCPAPSGGDYLARMAFDLDFVAANPQGVRADAEFGVPARFGRGAGQRVRGQGRRQVRGG